MSFHLAHLMRDGLIDQRRGSRSVICTANFDSMNALVNYLTENCCVEQECKASSKDRGEVTPFNSVTTRKERLMPANNLPVPTRRLPERKPRVCPPTHSAPRSALTPQAETVILLHGSCGSGASWRRISDALRPLCQIVAPDLIGYGGSPRWPAGTPLDLDDECRALYPVLPCCASPYHLVGHSYGGVVALHLALACPTQVRTLTIIEPVFFQALRHAGDIESFDQFCRIRDDFIEALARGEREPAIARFIDFWTGDGAWERMPLAVRDATLKIADKIVLDWRASFAANPDLDRLAALGPRTLLLCGDRSPKPMQRLVDALNHLMPGSERAVISGADHLLPMSHTQAVTNAIMSQLHADAQRRARWLPSKTH